MILTGGTVLTMDAAESVAEAIALNGDRIVAVGSADEVLRHRGEDTVIVDLQGSTVMPGFVDSHAHLGGSAQGDAEQFRQVQDQALRGGITTITEMGVSPELLDQLTGFDAAGLMRMRWNTYLLYNTNCGDPVESAWFNTYAQGEDVSAHIRNEGVKLFSDGGSCGVPAVTFEYPGGYGHGDLFLAQEDLTAAVQAVQATGHQIAIHALGDRAVEETMNAIEASLGGAPNDLRHRIEHNAIVRPDMMSRYNEIGIVPTFFGSYTTCMRINAEPGRFKYVVPDELGTWEWPWRAILDANPGLAAAWHSDYPVFPDISPMAHLYGLVTRAQRAEDGSVCEPPDWLAQGAITVDEALRMMTINAAYAIFREHEIGSLESGKLADLVILSDNPREVDPAALPDIEVMVTIIGGVVEHCADGAGALCLADGAGGPTDSTVPSGPTGIAPIGYLDFPSPDAVVSGIVGVEGWALADSGIERVEVYVDGVYVGDAVYGHPRPDVDNDYPGRAGAPNFGYVFDLDTTTLANGPHTIGVVAVARSGDAGPMIPEVLSVTVEN